MTTTDEQTQEVAAFDLDAAIAQQVAHHHTEQVKKQLHEDGERRQAVAKRRAECEAALAKAFPAEIREALGIEVDERCVVNSNGYPNGSYPMALFTLDEQLWHITLEYGNGVYISAPDGQGDQSLRDENVDNLLLQIGLWREREAERKRLDRLAPEESDVLQHILGADENAEPATPPEPVPPRMIGDEDDTTVAFILSESLSYYTTAVEQMQVKFTGSMVHLSHQDGMRKPHNFSLTDKQFEALIAARDLYRAHLAVIKERQQARQSDKMSADEVPF